MQPDPTKLLSILEISNSLLGFYDTPEKHPFEPFIAARKCVFSCYQGWMQGESTCLSEQNVASIGCPGAGYWNCNVATVPSEHVAHFLAVGEGLKASSDLMCQWLANQPPYKEGPHVRCNRTPAEKILSIPENDNLLCQSRSAQPVDYRCGILQCLEQEPSRNSSIWLRLWPTRRDVR